MKALGKEFGATVILPPTAQDYSAEVAQARQVEIRLEKIEDLQQIMAHGVLSTPGVVIDGKVVMRERQMLTLDMEKLRARLAKHHPRLMARFDAEVA